LCSDIIEKKGEYAMIKTRRLFKKDMGDNELQIIKDIVPANMYGFIKENIDYIELKEVDTINGTSVEELVVDVKIYHKGNDGYDVATFYFPQDKEKYITARFDCISTMDDVIDCINKHTCNEVKRAVAIGIAQGLFDKVQKRIKKLGFELRYSHAMRTDYYGWHDIYFNSNQWDKNKYLKIENYMYNFNKDIDKVFEQLKKRAV
jgi:hypothetical protein